MRGSSLLSRAAHAPLSQSATSARWVEVSMARARIAAPDATMGCVQEPRFDEPTATPHELAELRRGRLEPRSALARRRARLTPPCSTRLPAQARSLARDVLDPGRSSGAHVPRCARRQGEARGRRPRHLRRGREHRRPLRRCGSPLIDAGGEVTSSARFHPSQALSPRSGSTSATTGRSSWSTAETASPAG